MFISSKQSPAIWKKDLAKVNPKAAESLADPEEYSNLFEDWQVALAIEANIAQQRHRHGPSRRQQIHLPRASFYTRAANEEKKPFLFFISHAQLRIAAALYFVVAALSGCSSPSPVVAALWFISVHV